MSDAQAVLETEEAPEAVPTEEIQAATEEAPAEVVVEGLLKEFPIDDALKQAVAQAGFATPPTEWKTLTELALDGRDLVVRSEPGASKANAYGIPLLEKLRGEDGTEAPRALVIVPTRELAQMVSSELRKLATSSEARVVSLYGGVPVGRQTTALKQGADILVSTPGRLLDHMRRGNLSLDEIQWFVLDDADELVSMNLWSDVVELLRKLPDERQTMVFSAVQTAGLVEATQEFLSDAEHLDLTGQELSLGNATHLRYDVAEGSSVAESVALLLDARPTDGTIVFCDNADQVEEVAKVLQEKGFPSKMLRGSVKPRERERLTDRIENKQLRTLVATDVAARGIDLSSFNCVVNMTVPEHPEVYLHRVFRLNGAADTSVISVCTEDATDRVQKVSEELSISFEDLATPSEADVVANRNKRVLVQLVALSENEELDNHRQMAAYLAEQGDEGVAAIAFLLKQYTDRQNQQRRQPAAAPAPAKSENTDAEASAPSRGGDSEEGRGDGRRRKRRRTRSRRGRSSEENMDVVDASTMLDRGNTTPPAVEQSEAYQTLGQDVDVATGMALVKVNVGFDDGFRGRGAVAKKIVALAGLADGAVDEVEAHRSFSLLRAPQEVAELVVERVDGAPLGKKVLTLSRAK